jgi:two-component system, NarL family, sensor kinase
MNISKPLLVTAIVYCWALSGWAQVPILDTLINDINARIQQPPSFVRDTAIVLSLSLLTERSINLQDTRATAFKDSLKKMTERLNWPKGKGLYLRALGKEQDRMGNYPEALNYYEKAIKILEKAGGNPYELAYAYVLAGFVMNNNNDQEACIKYLSKALPLSIHAKNTNNLCWIYDFLGDYHYYDKFGHVNYPKALYYYKLVEKNLVRANSPNLKADNPHCLANVYYKLGNTQLAEQYRNKALKIALTLGQRLVVFAIYGDLAQIAEEKRDWPKAIRYRKMSLAYAQQSGWREFESRAYNSLYQSHKQSGNFKEALIAYEQHRALEDTLKRDELQQKYSQLQTENQVEKQQLKIKALENEKLLQTRNFLVGFLALGLLLIGFVMWYNQKLRRNNEVLATKNKEIQEALVRGQTMERKRVASELHDNLNTKLAALRWRLEAFDISKYSIADQKIHQSIVEGLEDVYADVRLISHNLLPAELETEGLTAAFEKLIAKLNNSKTQFNFAVSQLEPRLDATTEYQLYNIALELINNILKHAKASQVWLSVSKHNQLAILTVSDNGVGFNNKTISEGVGLRNIAARVEAMQGRWNVESKPQTGTKITVEIPA